MGLVPWAWCSPCGRRSKGQEEEEALLRHDIAWVSSGMAGGRLVRGHASQKKVQGPVPRPTWIRTRGHLCLPWYHCTIIQVHNLHNLPAFCRVTCHSHALSMLSMLSTLENKVGVGPAGPLGTLWSRSVRLDLQIVDMHCMSTL